MCDPRDFHLHTSGWYPEPADLPDWWNRIPLDALHAIFRATPRATLCCRAIPIGRLSSDGYGAASGDR